MKLRKVQIENFKRFDELELDFTADGSAEKLKLILGDNGSGKSTLLQAIALPLSMAMEVIHEVPDFDWVGFLPGRYNVGGEPFIRLEIEFDDDELEATASIAKEWDESRPQFVRDERPFHPPGNSSIVHLELRGNHLSARSSEEMFQFKGRSYARRLMRTGGNVREQFHQLPGLFWFDQYRNLGSAKHEFDSDSIGGRQSFDIGVSKLRKYLIGWYFQKRSAKGEQPFSIDLLEQRFAQIFPGHKFLGVEPMPGVDSPTSEDFYFLLRDAEKNQYDIEEMSAGEQAVLPILYEFIRQRIGKSLVLIDEVDLNLHPPAAQLFAGQLLKIASDCQFIVTTHSEAVTNVFARDEIVRLEGGRLCL